MGNAANQIQIRNQAGLVDSDNPFPTKDQSALVPELFDYISVDYTDATTETYSYKSGGVSGTLVATVVIVYTDATKANLSTVTKT